MGGELVFARAGFGPAALAYDDALALQRLLHARRAAGEIPDVCLLLEHQPVYTAGRRTAPLGASSEDGGLRKSRGSLGTSLPSSAA